MSTKDPSPCVPNHNLTELTQEHDYKQLKDGTKAKSTTNMESQKVVFSPHLMMKPQNPLVHFIEHYRNTYSSPENFIKRRIDYGQMKVSDNELRKESERLITLQDFPKHLSHLVKAIAKSGFYFIGDDRDPDKVKCIYCQGILSGWKKTDFPNKEHKKAFPTCPYLLNLNVGNLPLKENSENVSTIDRDLVNFDGEIVYNVIGMATKDILNQSEYLELNFECRETTFENHKHLKYLCLQYLFIETEDEVSFIKCSLCTKKVEILKDLEKLPTKSFHHADCRYEDLAKVESQLNNKSTISTTTQSKNKHHHCEVEYAISNEEIEAQVDSKMRYEMAKISGTREKIKSLITAKFKSSGKDYDTDVEWLYELRNGDKQPITDREMDSINEYLFPDLSCTVCLANPVQVVFLPCGHLRTCNDCSNKLSSCPICRTVIEKKVRGLQFVYS